MMHPDIEAVAKALYSGQCSAVKIDAQRAFERMFEKESGGYWRVRPRPRGTTDGQLPGPPTAEVVRTWDSIKGMFHALWGNNATGKYDKALWVKLQQHLERLEAATEALGPIGRENLIAALRRIELPGRG